jgi:S1-C subfamily serine protease
LLIDLLIVGLTAAAAYWGYRQGLSSGALALIGFGGGAILGSRIAPLILDGGFRDPFAPALALPAALLFGALLAAALERLGFNLRLRVRRRSQLDVIGGTVLAACVGLVAVWVVGALAARAESLRDPLRDSVIIEKLNAVLPPPGPLLKAEKPPTDPLPQLVGPAPNVGPADPAIRADPEIRAAKASVVEVLTSGCGGGGTGTGWIARDGIVVTNAHVIRGTDDIQVQPGGNGPKHDAEAIWFDEERDIGILRAQGVSGVRGLPIAAAAPRPGTFAATLGYPGGGPYAVGPARIGDTTSIPNLSAEGQAIPGTVTSLRVTLAGFGSSGSPVMSRNGRVVTMIRGGNVNTAYGVPIKSIRRALRRAGPTVDTGDCH